MKKTINFLLNESCPSIQYRVNKEILGNKINYLQSKILDDPEVRGFIKQQNKSGWIDQDLHSENGVETAIRVFFEKGLDNGNSFFTKMLSELEKREDSFDNGCLEKVGRILDEKGFGGSRLIRATLFCYAGFDNKEFVQEQIEAALRAFEYVTRVNSLDEITEVYKNKLVFSKGAIWPGIYHLRLLAFSKSWRNEKNKEIIMEAIKKLIELSPIPSINVLSKGQLISPASFCMHDFKPQFENMNDKEWMMWFHRTEMLARLGMMDKIDKLNQQIEWLKRYLSQHNELFVKRLKHYYFRKWGPYTGMRLEKDWRIEKRRISDLSFRSLLVLHYSSVKQNRF
jgi:hypothetical protein